MTETKLTVVNIHFLINYLQKRASDAEKQIENRRSSCTNGHGDAQNGLESQAGVDASAVFSIARTSETLVR